MVKLERVSSLFHSKHLLCWWCKKTTKIGQKCFMGEVMFKSFVQVTFGVISRLPSSLSDSPPLVRFYYVKNVLLTYFFFRKILSRTSFLLLHAFKRVSSSNYPFILIPMH